MHRSQPKDIQKITVHRGRPFTEQMMKDAWAKLPEEFASEPALANMLKKFVPELAPDGRYVLVVDSNGTQSYISDRLEEIMPKMRDALVNDDFTFAFSVKEVSLSPEFWSDTQVLSHIMQNPDFAAFYNHFGLSLL